MKYQMLVLSILLVLSVAALADPTQARLSLEKAIDEGGAKSPTAKKYESAKSEADWKTYSGMSGLLPHLSLNAGHDFTAQYETVPVNLGGLSAAVPEVYPRTYLGIEASWVVFDGLSSIRHYQASLDLFHAAEKESSRKNFEVRKKIELAFYNAVAAKKFEEVAVENLKTVQENIAQVKYRLDAGVATQYDVLRVEVQLSDATTDLERAHDNVVIQRKQLAEAMGSMEDERELEGDLPIPQLAEQVGALSSPNIEQREDFQASHLRSAAADKEAGAAIGKLFPSLALSANYLKYENTGYPGEAYGGFRDAYAVGAYLKWNLFDGGESIAEVGANRAKAMRSEQEYQETILKLPTEFALWKRRYVYSTHYFDSKKKDVLRSEESFRIAKVAFQQGQKTITEVLEAETDLFRARAGVVQSQLDAEEALIKLELTIGKEI